MLLLEGEKANCHCFEEKTRNIIQKEIEDNQIESSELESIITFVKKEKYAYTNSYLTGITAIAAPVFDYKKELVASICIVGVTEGMDISRDSIVIRELLKNAQELFGAIRIFTILFVAFSF